MQRPNVQRPSIRKCIHQLEENGNYSFVGLAQDAIPVDMGDAWWRYLKGEEFYGGKTSFGEIPRLQRFVCDVGEYFGKRAGWVDDGNPRWVARKYGPEMQCIQSFVQSYFDDNIAALKIPGVKACVLDSCLANMYRSQGDSIKPHRDSEVIFGDNPSVMIVSLGCPREIIFERIIYDKDNINSIKKEKGEKAECVKIMLPPRSILCMGGETQKYYSHEIKKVLLGGGGGGGGKGGKEGVRFSLTFRQYG